MAGGTIDLGLVRGPNQVTADTSTTLTGVLKGNGSVVGVQAVDSAPTASSTNLVTSDGVKTALMAIESELAYAESGSTASRAYAVGDYFCWGGTLYRAKTAISSGAAFTVGTNCEQVTAGGLNELKNAITPSDTTSMVNNLKAGFSVSEYLNYWTIGKLVIVDIGGLMDSGTTVAQFCTGFPLAKTRPLGVVSNDASTATAVIFGTVNSATLTISSHLANTKYYGQVIYLSQ